MESLSNQQGSGNSNVELTLLGMDKKWVRYNGSWVDKSTIPVETKKTDETTFMSMEIEGSTSPWWQFWKA